MNKQKTISGVASIEKRFSILRMAVAIGISLILAFALILTISDAPFRDMLTFLIGPLTSVKRLSVVVEKTIPLLFTGTAVCLMTACGQVNLAVEGSFFAGTFVSTAVAIQQGIPSGLHFILCALAGGLAGALLCWLPGYLNVKFGIMTVVSSLMINYISLYTGLYIVINILRDPDVGYEASRMFAEGSRLPVIIPGTKVHLGLVIGIAVVAIGAYILYRTKFGYTIRTVGLNADFAKYSGIAVGSTIILTQALGGFFAGLGGTVEILGLYSRFSFAQLTQHGFDGFMIAIVAKNNPRNVPFAALFLAYIRTAADVLNRTSSIPTEMVKVVQAVVIMFVAAEKLLSGMEHKAIVRNTQLQMHQREEE